MPRQICLYCHCMSDSMSRCCKTEFIIPWNCDNVIYEKYKIFRLENYSKWLQITIARSKLTSGKKRTSLPEHHNINTYSIKACCSFKKRGLPFSWLLIRTWSAIAASTFTGISLSSIRHRLVSSKAVWRFWSLLNLTSQK